MWKKQRCPRSLLSHLTGLRRMTHMGSKLTARSWADAGLQSCHLRLSRKHCRHKGGYTLHIIPCVQVKRLVAATCCGDTSHQQIAFCVLEKFCEKLCLYYRILLRQQVTQVLSDLVFCNMLLWQNSPVHAKQFVAVMCRREMLLQLVTSCVPTLKPWPCFFFNCSNFRFLMWILICDSF